MTISLRHSISTIALSTALVMGACSPKDKGGSPQISAEAAPLGLKAPSEQVFARHFAVEKRDVSSADSQKALAQLGLAESGAGDLSWAAREGDNGNYIFTDLSSKTEDGTIKIAQAELFGVRMEGEDATFDRVDFTNLMLDDEDVDISIENMSLARPTPDTAKAIVKSIEKISDSTDMDININEEENFGFGAISLNGITLSGEEVSGKIDQMVYGSDAETELADFKIENIDLTITGKSPKADSIASVLTLKSLSGLSLRTDQMKKGFDSGVAGSGLGAMLGNLNMYETPYDSFALEDLVFDNANVNVTLSGVEGKASTKGDVTTIRQVSEPMVITLKEAPQSPQARQFYDIMEKLEFDDIQLTSSQTSVLDKGADTVRVQDGILEMKDGFKLNYTYGASGLDAMQKVMQTGSNEVAQQKAAMEVLTFDDLKISLEDNSIIERGLKLAAELRGADPDRVKKEMRVAVTMAPLMARNDLEKELAGELGGAFMDFIDNGGTLTIELDPKEPVPMSQLMELDQSGGSLKELGFSARQDN